MGRGSSDSPEINARRICALLGIKVPACPQIEAAVDRRLKAMAFVLRGIVERMSARE